MTKQEAIEMLKDWNKDLECVDEEGCFEAKKLAIEALEKQIPKKGIPYDSAKNHRLIECPSCHKKMDLYYDCCQHCGQKIYWEKKNKKLD